MSSYKIKPPRQDLILLLTLPHSSLNSPMKRPKHLLVETEDAERCPDAAEHQRQVVQKQLVDTLTVRQPAKDDATDCVRDANHRDENGGVRLGGTHLRKMFGVITMNLIKL